MLQSEPGVVTWLANVGVTVKEFLSFAEGLTKRFCRKADELAEKAKRKVKYLPGPVDKEDLVQEIRQKERQWLELRKTVIDLPRRAELSHSSNERYLEALSTITTETPLSELTDQLCRPVEMNGRRHRGLRPFDPEEVQLLQAVSRGEF